MAAKREGLVEKVPATAVQDCCSEHHGAVEESNDPATAPAAV